MPSESDDALVRGSAGRLYGEGQPVWSAQDRWNTAKRKNVDRFARRFAVPYLDHATRVLDAGSGNQPYDWVPADAISLDRFSDQVKGLRIPVAGDLQQLPFRAGTFDFVVCVGPVINYTSAAESIAELSRVTVAGGHLLLHFESSTSFEFLGTKHWGRLATRVETINGGRTDTVWVYRPTYIRQLLQQHGFREVETRRFHILSALGVRVGLSQDRSAPASALDGWAAPLAGMADDVILVAEKS